jgi:hypothetical protein
MALKLEQARSTACDRHQRRRGVARSSRKRSSLEWRGDDRQLVGKSKDLGKKI